MNREEKNHQTRQKILMSALKEFGRHSYTEASLNTISKEGELSKGIIYHYFKDKDELYLECVSFCFRSLVAFLTDRVMVTGQTEADISEYVRSRSVFFEEHPDLINLFTSALTQPPRHLEERMRAIRQELDEYNRTFFKGILKNVALKEAISPDEAMDYFLMFQESFNYYFQKSTQGDLKELFDQHELKLRRFLNFFLYGIAKEKTV